MRELLLALRTSLLLLDTLELLFLSLCFDRLEPLRSSICLDLLDALLSSLYFDFLVPFLFFASDLSLMTNSLSELIADEWDEISMSSSSEKTGRFEATLLLREFLVSCFRPGNGIFLASSQLTDLSGIDDLMVALGWPCFLESREFERKN